MSVFLGGSNIEKIYLGDTEITSAWLGNSEVYSSAPKYFTITNTDTTPDAFPVSIYYYKASRISGGIPNSDTSIPSLEYSTDMETWSALVPGEDLQNATTLSI